MRKPWRTRVRERAEQLLPESRHWAEAWQRAYREIREEERGGPPQPVTDEVLQEAADELFVGPKRPRISDAELAEVAEGLFGDRAIRETRGEDR